MRTHQGAHSHKCTLLTSGSMLCFFDVDRSETNDVVVGHNLFKPQSLHSQSQGLSRLSSLSRFSTPIRWLSRLLDRSPVASYGTNSFQKRNKIFHRIHNIFQKKVLNTAENSYASDAFIRNLGCTSWCRISGNSHPYQEENPTHGVYQQDQRPIMTNNTYVMQ
ncbi:hypothetical protein M758_4G030300 [Ceratodon purpureus]|nr:hypothetical protein M758_4G030300 [Ceratodon purpureus]